ncbi:hypothetical protein VOLCADRAFT_91905 [Volvox carteri f. nagariensis]|uniref:GAF domain-containing protein n=1 Tax=Volvox carteri f. nagariensis TaxID=3068 RepID=D8TY94_VOLCA|nr:uncharacterized protein VOLCADRAFT_91905 [Volvox carteri f. nagariensis]EFJ47605.1 hypothetical protein VOLCADRAFT_91905 [Volvox carteri f. nagariensis]|eukprot:XP_002951429.1 hypothetical protein VOLCADRAFT_91905 [Volvox carteri f. nagariensis]
MRILNCCFRPLRTEPGLDGNNSSECDAHELEKEVSVAQRNNFSSEKSRYKDEALHQQVSLAHAQRVISAIAGACEEAWLCRIDAALAVVQEHFDAESVSLHAVYDGGLSFATLSACGIGAEDLPRGLPYSLTQDLTSSVAVLLANQRLNDRHGLRHFISAPLLGGDLVVGALTLASRRGSLPPPSWQSGTLALVAATLCLLLQQRQLSIATSIMTEIHLSRNIDELVRAVRRGVYDMVVATTHLPPVLRLALIRTDGSAAAVFEEQPQRRSSFTRLSVCSEAAAPAAPAGVPEMLLPGTSRRSIDVAAGRISANQLLGQQQLHSFVLTRDRLTGNNPQLGASLRVEVRAAGPWGISRGRPRSFMLPADAAPAAAAAPAAGVASDQSLDRGWVPGASQERLTVPAAAAAAAAASGARGHSLSLSNTLLGEALQKDCGLWISDCTLYLQEARTFPRDIVFSRGSRAVHSIAVCSGRHNGLPLLGAYCVYGAVLPRQLLRAVTLEVEQLLKNRLSASMAPEVSVALGVEGSPIRAPGSPRSQLAQQLAGGGGGPPPPPQPVQLLPMPVSVATTGMRANEQLYERCTSVMGVPRTMAAAAAAAAGAADGVPLPSSMLLSTATRFSDATEGESASAGPAQDQAVDSVPALTPGQGFAPGLAPPARAAGGPRPAILTSLRAMGLMAKSSSGTSCDVFLPPSLVDGVMQSATAATPAPLHAGTVTPIRPCSTGSPGAPSAFVFVSSLLGSPAGEMTGTATATATAVTLSCQDSSIHNTAVALRTQGSGVAAGGGSLCRTTGSMMRTMLAAPSFTVESVRSSLGGGLRRAPLVSGLHERLAAAQASRLVHGSAIEHQEELAAIEVLEKASRVCGERGAVWAFMKL